MVLIKCNIIFAKGYNSNIIIYFHNDMGWIGMDKESNQEAETIIELSYLYFIQQSNQIERVPLCILIIRMQFKFHLNSSYRSNDIGYWVAAF